MASGPWIREVRWVTKSQGSGQADTSRKESRKLTKAHAQASTVSPPTQANNTTQAATSTQRLHELQFGEIGTCSNSRAQNTLLITRPKQSVLTEKVGKRRASSEETICGKPRRPMQRLEIEE